jgi:uncharacterized membrane protein YvbJ
MKLLFLDMFCTSCGFEIIEESSKFCSKCGTTIIPTSEKIDSTKSNVSDTPLKTAHGETNWWYVAPILFGIIGGIIAFLILRKKDPRLAKGCFICGAFVTVILFLLEYYGVFDLFRFISIFIP